MSTKSILKDFVVSDNASALKLLRAIERSKRASTPQIDVVYKKMDRETMDRLFKAEENR